MTQSRHDQPRQHRSGTTPILKTGAPHTGTEGRRLKVLIYPHVMEIGGSQLNALELADGISKAGHDVTVFAPDGELYPLAESMDFKLVKAPTSWRWPSTRNIRRLHKLVKAERFDVLHAYECGPAIDIFFGPHRSATTPMVTTILSMDVPDLLPLHSPIIVGTGDLLADQLGFREHAHLVEPQIDTDRNRPWDESGTARAQFGFDNGDIVVAVVCRLSTDLDKTLGVLEAITVIGDLAECHSVRFLIIGDGEGLSEVHARANAVNQRHSRPVIVVAGGMVDPRAGYAAADIVIGMGSSAMKGMSFGKPLIVQGEAGFWRLLEPDTLPMFLRTGWFGNGGRGEADLNDALERLLADKNARETLGAFGRAVVVSRFSLRSAIERHIAIYRSAIENKPSDAQSSSDFRRTVREVVKCKVVVSWKLKTFTPTRRG